MKKITSIYRLLDEVKAAANSAEYNESNNYLMVTVELRASEANPHYKAWIPSIGNYIEGSSANELVENVKAAVAGVKTDISLEDDRAPNYKEQELFPTKTEDETNPLDRNNFE